MKLTYAQLQHRDLQIGLIESIGYVPAQWAILATFLYDSMEEADAKEQTCKGAILLGTASIELWVIDRFRVVGAHEILL